MFAEIALAEGELLALRLPMTATHLLRLACEQFAECGDKAAAYRANVLLVLTLARAGGDPRSMRLREEAPVRESDADTGWIVRRELARQLVRGESIPPAAGPSPECDTHMDDLERCDPQAFEPLGAGHHIDLMMSIGQASVRFDLDHGSRFWSACRIEGSIDLLVAPAPLVLHLETIDGWPDLHRVPADMHRSRRPYVVVPLVMPDEALAEKWEQRLGAVSPLLGSKALLYVRFRRMGDRQSVLRWRLELVMGLRWDRW